MSLPANFLIDPAELKEKAREITIDNKPGEATYVLPPFDLKNCAVALQRFLFGLHPIAAEELWWFRGQHQTTGKWTELRDGKNPFYTYSDGVSGRSGTTLPAGVDPKDVTVISLPSPPPTTLRDYYNRLIEQFDDNNPEDSAWKATLRERAKGLKFISDPQLDGVGFSATLEPLRNALAKGAANAQFIEQYINGVISNYTNCFIHAALAADICLTARVIEYALPYRFTFNPGVSLESLISSDRLETILTGVFKESQISGEMLEVIRKACESLQTKGEELQEAALDATSVGQFYGLIYSSAAWLFAALRGFKFIASMEQFPKKTNIAIHVCDELCTVANCSMHVQFADALDYRDLLSRRELVAQRRVQAGDDGAEQLADQYIETELLYPSFNKPFLLGQTSVFYSKAPTS